MSNDLISREAVLEIIMKYCPDDDGSCSCADTDPREMLDEIESIPILYFELVRHRRWDNGRCSECGEEAPYTEIAEDVYDYDWEENLRYSHTEIRKEYYETPYCPSCGAKMDGGEMESG